MLRVSHAEVNKISHAKARVLSRSHLDSDSTKSAVQCEVPGFSKTIRPL